MSDTPQIALDLDQLQQEHEQKAAERPKFKVKAGGTDVFFEHPDDLTIAESERVMNAINSGGISDFFYVLIKDNEQLDAFFEADYAAEVINRVVNDYLKFNGWDPRRGTMNREARRKQGKK